VGSSTPTSIQIIIYIYIYIYIFNTPTHPHPYQPTHPPTHTRTHARTGTRQRKQRKQRKARAHLPRERVVRTCGHPSVSLSRRRNSESQSRPSAQPVQKKQRKKKQKCFSAEDEILRHSRARLAQQGRLIRLDEGTLASTQVSVRRLKEAFRA
jgi:hypothetical protein